MQTHHFLLRFFLHSFSYFIPVILHIYPFSSLHSIATVDPCLNSIALLPFTSCHSGLGRYRGRKPPCIVTSRPSPARHSPRCTYPGRFCRYGQSPAPGGRRGSGHTAVNRWRAALKHTQRHLSVTTGTGNTHTQTPEGRRGSGHTAVNRWRAALKHTQRHLSVTAGTGNTHTQTPEGRQGSGHTAVNRWTAALKHTQTQIISTSRDICRQPQQLSLKQGLGNACKAGGARTSFSSFLSMQRHDNNNHF